MSHQGLFPRAKALRLLRLTCAHKPSHGEEYPANSSDDDAPMGIVRTSGVRLRVHVPGWFAERNARYLAHVLGPGSA